MNYRNTEMKLDQLVNYFNEEKINLSPAFQRGHVWSLRARRKLIVNVVLGRPIPAIFLYKEASGARYSYNILDGKQRLESLMLFVGSKRADFSVKTWAKYFFSPKLRKDADFWIQLPTGKKTFKALDEQIVRDFREYAIPTVEINLTDDSHLDEIINLFVDINQQGVPVGRFDIVKAMGRNNTLLRDVFDLLAVQQQRDQDVFYRAKSNEFTFVLKSLDTVSMLADGKSQVDRMWQQLLEIVLFQQTKKHRKPGDILKSFISGGSQQQERFKPLSAKDEKALRKVFKALAAFYRHTPQLRELPLAREQTLFYTMITALIATELMTKYSADELSARLLRLSQVFAYGSAHLNLNRNKAFVNTLSEFLDLISDRTGDAPRRENRQRLFVDLVAKVG
jgi:hypothetical protein